VRTAEDAAEATTLATGPAERVFGIGADSADDDSGRHHGAGGVRWRRWSDLLRRRHQSTGRWWGRLGTWGTGNLHPTFLTDERDHEEIERVHLALDEIVNKTLSL